MDDSRPAVGRSAWLRALVESVAGKRAAKPVRTALSRRVEELGGADLSTALVIAEVADSHGRGELLGDIVNSLARRGVVLDEASGLDAALAAIGMFRARGLSDERWWNTTLLHITFLELWAAEARRHDAGGVVRQVLEDMWRLDPEAALAFSTEPAKLEALQDLGPRWGMESAPALQAAVRAELPESGRTNPALVELASWLAVRKELESGNHPDPVEASERSKLAVELDALLVKHINRLTLYEMALLQPLVLGERLFAGYVAILRRRITMTMLSGLGLANGISDRVEGQTLVADWLADMIFSAGARSGFDSSGPTAYLWLALEAHEDLADGGPAGIGLAEHPDTPYPVELVVVLGPEDDAPSMSFPMGHNDVTREFLALLMLTRRVIIDIFRIEDDGRIALLHRYATAADPLLDKITDRVIATLEQAKPQDGMVVDRLDDHIVGGFVASENAKAELLLSLDEEAVGEGADLLMHARAQFLDAQVARAMRVHLALPDLQEAETQVRTARAELTAAWGSFRSSQGRERRGGPVDPVVDLKAMVQGLATERRALVHFNLQAGHLQGFWMADGGGERGWVSCEEVDFNAIRRALRPWLEGDDGDVDQLIEAASPIAVELEGQLALAGVDQAVIMPRAMLQGVPFGALRLAKGRLDDRLTISYSPSVAMLRIAERDVPSRPGPALASAHDGSLPWADAEVRAIGALYDCPSTVGASRSDVVAAMGSGRLIHVASHGRWWREDHFASVLDLELGGEIDRHISMAQIHRDVSLRGAELVALSSCDTGRAPSGSWGIDEYTGIDAAFLMRGAKAVVSTMWPVGDFAALLFSVNMHAQLLMDNTVGDAFTNSVHVLRQGGDGLDVAAAEALDRHAPSWRAERDRLSPLLTQARTWATFKLSGAHWLAQPVPRLSAPAAAT